MRITRVFLDTDMRQNFEGLRACAEKANAACGEASVLLFLNRRATYFKMLVANRYLVAYKHKGRIPLDALVHLPEQFGGGDMEMAVAIRKSLAGKLNIEVPE